MKNQNISGDTAAISNTQSPSPCQKTNSPAANGQLQFDYISAPPEYIEPLVSKKTLADHYGLSIRTINYAMTLGLPRVPVGGRVRFRFSEVQSWFEKNGCRRFASEGIKLAIQKSLAKQFHFNLSDQVHITVSNPQNPSPKRDKGKKL